MSAPRSAAPERGGQAGAAGAAPSRLRSIWDQFGTLAVAVLLALAIRAFVIEPFRIPSGSMFPTLLIGDHLFVNKFVYGPRIPFTDLHLPALPRAAARRRRRLRRGAQRQRESFPADRRPELPRETFVKRIVGHARRRDRGRGDGIVRSTASWCPTERTGEKFVDENGRTLDVAREDLGEFEHEILDDPRRQRPSSSRPFRGRRGPLPHDGRQPRLLEGQPRLGHGPRKPRCKRPGLRSSTGRGTSNGRAGSSC